MISDYTVLVGDCVDSLRKLGDNEINCCVTSPPYYGLRDYGVDGQIGLEKTPTEYINKLVTVFREIKRVLRDDGVLWINIGDTYAGSGKGAWNNKEAQIEKYVADPQGPQSKMPKIWKDIGIKSKDLIGIPWMLAFALRNDGWYLRQDIIWHKPNAMPSSVKDRCTTAHEYLFLLSKSKKYYLTMNQFLKRLLIQKIKVLEDLVIYGPKEMENLLEINAQCGQLTPENTEDHILLYFHLNLLNRAFLVVALLEVSC